MNLSGRVAALITSGALMTMGWGSPAHASDNGKITFTQQGLVAVMDALPGLPTYLGHNPAGYPAFAPDGSRIAVVNTSGALTTFLPDGTGDVTVANGLSQERMAPAWSPDATKLAYFGTNGGDLKTLLVSNATVGASQIEVTDLVGNLDGSISWSPDGLTLLYSAPGGIWKVSPTPGANPVQVTIPGYANMRDYAPSWSPDGSRFAFVRDCYTCSDPSKSGVWTAAADGSNPQQVVSDNVQSPPSWSPDGKLIAFATVGANNRIVITPATGGAQTILLAGPGIAAPSWGGKPAPPQPVEPAPKPVDPPPAPAPRPVAPSLVTPPQVTGDLVFGKKLRSSPGTWTGNPTSVKFQWMRCNADKRRPYCRTISDATKATYTIGQEDLGKRLHTKVTAANAVGQAVGSSSSVLVPLPPKGKPVLITFKILTMARNGTVTVPVAVIGRDPIVSATVSIEDYGETVKDLDKAKEKVNVPVDLSPEGRRKVLNRPVVKMTLVITIVTKVHGKIFNSKETVDIAVARR